MAVLGADRVASAELIAEYTISLDAKKPTAHGRVVFPVDSTQPAPAIDLAFVHALPCQRLLKKKRELKVLAFFDGAGRQLSGLEHPALLQPVLEARTWHDERMRAVEAAQLWERPKKALASDNPVLRRLAADFLMRHDAADVVDAAWGAPSSAARRKHERRASFPLADLCK